MPAHTTSAPTHVFNRTNLAVLLAAFLGWLFDGFEMGVFPLIARPALQQMQASLGQNADLNYVGDWMGVITAAYLLGAAAGGIVFGWLGDRYGRVRAMAMSVLCYSFFTGITYFAQTPVHLTAARFFAALGMGGEWALGVALVMEVWPEKWRPALAGIIGMAANFGFTIIGCIGLFFKVTVDSWRWVALVGAAPALLTFLIRLFVPESERWQHAAASAPTHTLKEVMAPNVRRNALLAALFCGIMLVGTWGTVQWLPLWADQMTGGTVPQAKAYAQIMSAVGTIVGCLLGIFLGNFGRRWIYFLISLTSLVSCGILFRTVDAYGPFFLFMSFIVGIFTGAFFGWAPLYLPELFPTRVRTTAQGFAFNAGRILAAIGALQMSMLMRQFGGSFAQAGAVLSLVYGLGMIVIWFAPETKGRPLPD